MENWEGFDKPDTEFFKVPHAFIDAMAMIDNIGELKVLLYVMRHTWGFQEYDDFKRITTDEFCHGRKLKDGERMDAGTGLADITIRGGISKAIDHGFLECEVDKRDMGRIKKSYRMKMRERDEGASAPQSRAKPARKVNQSRIEELRAIPYTEYLLTPEWQKKRAKALRFAQFRCQLCNEASRLNVHHRTYERLGNERLGDLIVLCTDCHTIFHQNQNLSD